MKKTIKTWVVRLSATGVLLVALLLSIVLNPSLLYANQTVVDNYTIYHNSVIDVDLLKHLENVTSSLKKSELYDATYKLDICLNERSYYPTLLEKIRGKAFAWGFYNKVVLQGNAQYKENVVELNGYRWNLEQLLTHEAIHCYQYNKFGFWNSNPIANYPNWKWEGYPEYVSRQNAEQQDLFQSLDHLLKHQEEHKDSWFIEFSDGTISPADYHTDWLLVKYCLDIKQLSYEELLIENTKKEVVEEEMMTWYDKMKETNARRTSHQ